MAIPPTHPDGMPENRKMLDYLKRSGLAVPHGTSRLKMLAETADVILGRCPDDTCAEGLIRYKNLEDTSVACDSCPWEGFDEDVLGRCI